MAKNVDRAKALKARGQLPAPVKQDLSSIESRLGGIETAIKSSKAVPRETRALALDSHQEEIVSAIRDVRELLAEFRLAVTSLDIPNYSRQFDALNAKLDMPKQNVPWRLEVLRMGGATSPIKEVIANPLS